VFARVRLASRPSALCPSSGRAPRRRRIAHWEGLRAGEGSAEHERARDLRAFRRVAAEARRARRVTCGTPERNEGVPQASEPDDYECRGEAARGGGGARGARGRVDFGDSEVAKLEERQPLLMNLRRRSTHLVVLLEGGAEELGDGAEGVRRVLGNREDLAAGGG
jgi:hypothetical protein